MESRIKGFRTRAQSGRGVPLGVMALMLVAALVVAPAVALAASNAHEPGTDAGYASAYVSGTYLTNGSDFASKAAADWASAETIRIEMSEFSFSPSAITLEAGKPYILELVTVGDVKHEFTAPDFFPSAAWRKAESAESEVKATYFKEIEVFPGKQVDLYLVPITPGTYDLLCEIEGHFEAGMFGTITVTGSAPTSPAPVYASISEGPWVADGEAQVSAADWDMKDVITVNLSEFSFGPNEIHLKVGQPYQLNFTNIGSVKHEATAPEFFQNVAFRKAQDASGEFKAQTVLEVETFASKVTELWLIPTKAGTYDLVCEIEGHFEAGMFGTIVVEDAAGGFSPAVGTGATLSVYGGGSVALLESELTAAGAVSAAVTVDGEFIVLVAGSPSFVNQEFNSNFPAGLPAGTPILVLGN